jgi:hypothetical protein
VKAQVNKTDKSDARGMAAYFKTQPTSYRVRSCDRVSYGQVVPHLGDGRWWDAESEAWRDGKGRRLRLAVKTISFADIRSTRVYLAAAHLDHNPANNRPRNLKALCQRCHMLHDQAEHSRRRWFTLRMRKALGDLFLGPYRFG